MRPVMFAIGLGVLALAAGCGKKDAAGGSDDQDRVQGTWVVTKVELGADKDAKIQSKLDREIGNLEITVRGNLITAIPANKNDPGYATFTFDSSRSPKEVDFTAADKEGKAGDDPNATSRGIYKLEGDTLVIAVSLKAGDPRPTEFKSTGLVNEQGSVIVIHAKKK